MLHTEDVSSSFDLGAGRQRDGAWLFRNPAIDVFFVCGGIFWLPLVLLVVVAGFALLAVLLHAMPPVTLVGSSFSIGLPMPWLLLFGSLFLVDAHFGAPWIACSRMQDAPARALTRGWVPAALFVVTLVLARHPDALAAAVTFYFLAVGLHYVFQNVAVMELYCSRAGYRSDGTKCLLLKISLSLLSIGMALRVISDSTPFVVLPGIKPASFAVPSNVVPTFLLLAALAAALLACSVFVKWLNGKRPPVPAMLVLGSTVTVLLLPQLNSSLWLLVPALLHGAQSLALQACRHGAVPSARVQGEGFWAFYAKSFLLGLVVVVAVPTTLHWLGVDEMHAFDAAIVVFSLHHFVAEVVCAAALLGRRQPQVLLNAVVANA